MKKKIVIAAGGTGGHIFPGLAIGEELIDKGCQVIWIGSPEGMEAKLLSKYSIEIYYININGIRGKNWLTKFLSINCVFIAILQSLKILWKFNPDVILGMGGFVAGPVGIAAWLLRKKLIIHEQNAIAGTSNRLLAPFANKILESFPHSFPEYKYYLNKIIVTGLPIRKNLLINLKNLKEQITLSTSNLFKVLILGGSRGAKFLNQTIPYALANIDNLQIIHQTGEQDLTITKDLYLQLNPNHIHQIVSFIDDMADAYNNANLIICRAGAATIFEILNSNSASILIPLPGAIDDHQTKNALYLANNNAAIIVKQNELTINDLKSLVIELKNNPDKINSLKKSINFLYKKYADHNITNKIYDIIINL